MSISKTLNKSSILLTAMTGLSIALEDEANGLVSNEKEYVWYGTLLNPGELEKASSLEVQKQSTVKVEAGTIRVRQTMHDGAIDYILTAKSYRGRGDAKECSIPVSKDMYNVFKEVARSSMDKIRYVYPIEGTDLKWEVDVFIDPQGNPKGWVKIDLEVPGVITEWPPLPIQLGEVIFGGNDDYTPEQRAKLDGLFATVFENKL